MAVIYDFGDYHAPRLLSSFSQQTGDVRRQFADFRKNMDKLSAGLCRILDTQHTFCSQLGDCLLELEKAKEFAHTCSAACELNSIEQMVKKRDQIIRDRPKRQSN